MSIRIHDIEFAGETPAQKLERVRAKLTASEYDGIILDEERLDDIAWITDLRGDFDPYTPVFDARMYISPETALIFLPGGRTEEEINMHLTEGGITILDMKEWESFLTGIQSLKLSSDMVTFTKCVKTESETEHIRNCHLRDGVYVSRFIARLKGMIQKGMPADEMMCARLMDSEREEDELFISPSFPTIAGYGPHGAIIHYEPVPETNIPLEPRGLMVLDTGGQYEDGTTDVTRTVVLGPLTDEEKLHYTLVLQGMLRVLHSTFRGGEPTDELDRTARKPIIDADPAWDYRHGTGHGVGYCLQVHEIPCRITEAAFVPGMVFSDEPGIYIEGSHGVRIENLVVTVPAGREGELRFENLTWVPLERSAVEWSIMTDSDKKYFEEYMAETFEKLRPYLSEDELDILFK